MIEHFRGRLVSVWTDLDDGSSPFDLLGHSIVEPFPLSL